MADENKVMTQDVKLGPGLVLTPGHAHPVPPKAHGPVQSDRRVHADGSVDEVETLSTYSHPGQQGQHAEEPGTGPSETPARARA